MLIAACCDLRGGRARGRTGRAGAGDRRGRRRGGGRESVSDGGVCVGLWERGSISTTTWWCVAGVLLVRVARCKRIKPHKQNRRSLTHFKTPLPFIHGLTWPKHRPCLSCQSSSSYFPCHGKYIPIIQMTDIYTGCMLLRERNQCPCTIGAFFWSLLIRTMKSCFLDRH